MCRTVLDRDRRTIKGTVTSTWTLKAYVLKKGGGHPMNSLKEFWWSMNDLWFFSDCHAISSATDIITQSTMKPHISKYHFVDKFYRCSVDCVEREQALHHIATANRDLKVGPHIDPDWLFHWILISYRRRIYPRTISFDKCWSISFYLLDRSTFTRYKLAPFQINSRALSPHFKPFHYFRMFITLLVHVEQKTWS